MVNPTILIKIASYRDPEVIYTMAAALQMAADAERLRFAVVNQFDDATEHVLDPVRADPRANIIELPWRESRGLGQARWMTDQMYAGEDYTLQIDAHMRFAEGWDDSLVAQHRKIGHDRAVLSTYPGPYESAENGAVVATPAVPHAICVQGVDQHNLPAITGGFEVEPFSRGLLVGGCFIFGAGQATVDVPALREVLIGDESVHSLRLFTHGYDVVIPEVIPLYHRYAAQKNWQGEAFTPWNDFRESPAQWEAWMQAVSASHALAFALFTDDDHPALGTVRSRSDFFDQLETFTLDGVAKVRYGRGSAV